jgi:hypothetical protein
MNFIHWCESDILSLSLSFNTALSTHSDLGLMYLSFNQLSELHTSFCERTLGQQVITIAEPQHCLKYE